MPTAHKDGEPCSGLSDSHSRISENWKEAFTAFIARSSHTPPLSSALWLAMRLLGGPCPHKTCPQIPLGTWLLLRASPSGGPGMCCSVPSSSCSLWNLMMGQEQNPTLCLLPLSSHQYSPACSAPATSATGRTKLSRVSIPLTRFALLPDEGLSR